MSPILGHGHLHRRNLTDLMPRWLRIITHQPVTTGGATDRFHLDDFIDLRLWLQLPTMSLVSRLTPTLTAPRLRESSRSLLRPIRRRRLG